MAASASSTLSNSMNANEFLLSFFVLIVIDFIFPNLANYFVKSVYNSSAFYDNKKIITIDESMLVTKSLADLGIKSALRRLPRPGLLWRSRELLIFFLSF